MLFLHPFSPPPPPPPPSSFRLPGIPQEGKEEGLQGSRQNMERNE